MNHIFNDDFRDFLLALNKHDVRYLLIGGYTVILYGYPRTTGDIDIWIENTRENRHKLINACRDFGLPTDDLTKEKFENPAIEVFTFGRPPICIELIIRIKGADFGDGYRSSVIMEPDGFPVRMISYDYLVRMKKKAGRPKDLDDLSNIREPE